MESQTLTIKLDLDTSLAMEKLNEIDNKISKLLEKKEKLMQMDTANN